MRRRPSRRHGRCIPSRTLRLEVMEDRLLLSTFTVIDTADGTPGSLRQAILSANGNPGQDTIVFDIPGTGSHTIALTSALPDITSSVVIDGTSQPGYQGKPLIEIDGTNAGASAAGLHLLAGSCTIEGLAINRFAKQGIWVQSGSNVIQGNEIGTDVTGEQAAGNGSDGIFFDPTSGSETSANTVGGTTAAARNVISANKSAGIHFLFGGASRLNVIEGNYIGVDATGTQPLGNGANGVDFFMGDNSGLNTIGGTTAGAGNVISANGGHGIEFFGNGSSDNTVQGNLIGTDATGNEPLANNGNGVDITALRILVGGTTAAARNIISANKGVGVQVNSNSATVQGNFIGTDITGTHALGNQAGGVEISGATGALIGGTAPGAGNIIAFSGSGLTLTPSGVGLTSDSTGDAILSNSIFANGSTDVKRIGIDLNNDGVTLNTPGGPHTGANDLQNYPVLNSAASGAGTTTVQGTLNSSPNHSFIIQFFSNPSPDPSGHGQGRVFLGSIASSTDGSGNAIFSASLPAAVTVGTYVSATATDVSLASGTGLPINDTSEFSQDVQVASAGSADLLVSITDAPDPVTAGNNVTYTVTVTNNGPDLATGVVLTNTIPAGVTFVSANSSQGTTTQVGGVVTTQVGMLSLGATATLTVVVTPLNGGTITDKAMVVGNETDPNPVNNKASENTTVVPKRGVPADYDGDGKTDLAIFDQTGAQFFILLSGGGASIPKLGSASHSNIPVAGDFNGDGKTDAAIYDQTAALFFIQLSGGGLKFQLLGNPSHTNIPVAGDFDGDGKTDIGIFDQTTAQFSISLSGGGTLTRQFGNAAHTNIPLAGDFDGDGKTDLAVYDQTASEFFILFSGGGGLIRPFGDASHVNIGLTGDYDGDGKTDIGIYDQTASQFFILLSAGGALVPHFGDQSHRNIPLLGDYDGDGKTDIGIYDQTASKFYIVLSAGGTNIRQFGDITHVNIPLPTTYEGGFGTFKSALRVASLSGLMGQSSGAGSSGLFRLDASAAQGDGFVVVPGGAVSSIPTVAQSRPRSALLVHDLALEGLG